METPNIRTGRRVLFIGGPEAGRARAIPDSYGEFVKAEDGEYVYRIYEFRAGKDVLHLAFRNGDHILNGIVEMFREYSPAAQIKRETADKTYQTIAQNNST